MEEKINNFENVRFCALCKKQINIKHLETFKIIGYKYYCKGKNCCEVEDGSN